jgi:hypothetical protein
MFADLWNAILAAFRPDVDRRARFRHIKGLVLPGPDAPLANADWVDETLPENLRECHTPPPWF